MNILSETDHAEIAGELGRILKQIRKKDRKLVQDITNATTLGSLTSMDISNILLVNRAEVQSVRETVLAIRELLLTQTESQVFEELTDVENTVIDDAES